MERRKPYPRFRRWVDRHILHSTRPRDIMLPLAPAVLGAALFERGDAGWSLGMAAGALIFMWWVGRVYHVMRVVSYVAGRSYERTTRYLLPPEYADSTASRLSRFRKARKKRLTPRP